MLNLHKNLSKAKTEHERTLINRQITSTNNVIDKFVYELYNLSPNEIAIIRGLEEVERLSAGIETPQTGRRKRKKATVEAIKEKEFQQKKEQTDKRLTKKESE